MMTLADNPEGDTNNNMTHVINNSPTSAGGSTTGTNLHRNPVFPNNNMEQVGRTSPRTSPIAENSLKISLVNRAVVKKSVGVEKLLAAQATRDELLFLCEGDKEGLTARDKRWYNREIKQLTDCLVNHFGDDVSLFVGKYGWNFKFAKFKCLCDSRVVNVQV